jgi:WD40 repeat protein
VWNPDRPNVRYSTELKGHEAGIEKVAFNPTKDTELCSISSDGVAKIFDVRSRVCVNEVKGLGEAISLVWHPDGESIIVGNRVCHFTHSTSFIPVTDANSGRYPLLPRSNEANTNLLAPARCSDKPNCVLLERKKDLRHHRGGSYQNSLLSGPHTSLWATSGG